MNDEAALRDEICNIGKRMYARGFVAGNDGNVSCRLADGTVLCSPTLISKGVMEPADLAVVDLDGKQLSGSRKITSEIRLHLAVYRADPAVGAVVHCHPPYATAFGVAGVDVPTGILPEAEIFLGAVPRVEYETPGSEALAAAVAGFVGKANAVILSNHGTVSWGPTLERAYWGSEILDSYCRVLLLADRLGHVGRLPAEKVKELLALRASFDTGVDPRSTGEADLFVNPDFGR